MELKDQLKQIREVIRENIEYGNLVDAIVTAVAAYGNNCYNAALDKAAELTVSKSEKVGGIGGYSFREAMTIDKQSILNLKIGKK